MNKAKLMAGSVLLLAILNIVLLALLFSGKREGTRERPPHHRGPRNVIIERLGFSDDQTEKYDVLIREHRRAIADKDEQMRQARSELYRLLGSASDGRKDSLISGIAALQAETEKIHYEHFSAIRALCLPGQLDEFEELSADLSKLFGPPPHPPAP